MSAPAAQRQIGRGRRSACASGSPLARGRAWGDPAHGRSVARSGSSALAGQRRHRPRLGSASRSSLWVKSATA